MKTLHDWLFGWHERVAGHIGWLAPLFARIVGGWVSLWSGWGKLHKLPENKGNFVAWHIPAPHVLAPFVSGVEFLGGIFFASLALESQISAWTHRISKIRTSRPASNAVPLSTGTYGQSNCIRVAATTKSYDSICC